MAGRDFGGEMRLRLADGTNLTMRGAFTLGPSGVSVEAVTNQDHSVSRQATLKPWTAELTLEDSGTDVNLLMRAPRQDVYITEDFTGVSHVFMNAFFSGDAAVDRASGEWTGLTVNGDAYQRLGG
ncbi:phage tail tube protein [Aquabacter sp. CN5-332]|uniref:phage tail tube protein n=1 Tax=Aquabacter sp. CN5-332 TaxID=3156608 RepID=UPI0032B3325B